MENTNSALEFAMQAAEVPGIPRSWRSDEPPNSPKPRFMPLQISSQPGQHHAHSQDDEAKTKTYLLAGERRFPLDLQCLFAGKEEVDDKRTPVDTNMHKPSQNFTEEKKSQHVLVVTENFVEFLAGLPENESWV